MSGTKGVRVNLSLPDAFAEQLRGLHPRRAAPSAELCATLAAAKKRGWTHVALGNALGVTRERIRQLVEIAAAEIPDDQPITIEIPDLPPLPEPFQRVIPTLTEEQAQQLRDLRHQAMAMGCKTADHPAVVAGQQLAARVNDYIQAGHLLRNIAADLGITPGALRFRLARWGFYRLPPSQQHGSGPINQLRQRQEASHVR